MHVCWRANSKPEEGVGAVGEKTKDFDPTSAMLPLPTSLLPHFLPYTSRGGAHLLMQLLCSARIAGVVRRDRWKIPRLGVQGRLHTFCSLDVRDQEDWRSPPQPWQQGRSRGGVV